MNVLRLKAPHHFHTKLPYRKPLLRQTEWWIQNGAIAKNRVLQLFYFKNLIWVRETSRFEMQVSGAKIPGIKCHVPGARCIGYMCQVPGPRLQVSGVRLQILGARFPVPETIKFHVKKPKKFTLKIFYVLTEIMNLFYIETEIANLQTHFPPVKIILFWKEILSQ